MFFQPFYASLRVCCEVAWDGERLVAPVNVDTWLFGPLTVGTRRYATVTLTNLVYTGQFSTVHTLILFVRHLRHAIRTFVVMT